jgi:HNH endonuclease
MLDPGGAGGSFDDLTFAEKWHVQNATMQSRIKKDYEEAGKLNSITDSLLSHEGPATGFLYFSWAVNNVIANLGQGGPALEQATIDLAIVGGSNLASGMMGLAAGGDVTPEYNPNAFGSVSDDVRFEVYARDNYTCQYCGKHGGDLEIDHILSKKQAWDEGAYLWTDSERNAWSNDQSNLVTACRTCNAQKRDLDPFDWIFNLFTGKYGTGK